jgi:hypothetical protein
MAKKEKTKGVRVGTTDTDILNATKKTIIKYISFTNKNTTEISNNDGLGNGINLNISLRDSDNEVYDLPMHRLSRKGADGHFVQFSGGVFALGSGQALVASTNVENSVDCVLTYFED